MSVVWSGVTESGAVVPVQVDELGRVIATTGEPPGPPVINYNGASAWANFDGRGENGRIDPRGAMNVARITKISTGVYQVQFQNPLGSSNYSVVCGYTSYADELTPAGFLLKTYRVDDGTKLDASDTCFAVHSINALPPMGGTPTDAWATVDRTTVNGPCNVPASFNVESVTRTGEGLYDVLFNAPMPSSNYSVNITGLSGAGFIPNPVYGDCSTTGFSVTIYDAFSGSTFTDAGFSIQVNATDAALPVTYTREQLDAVVNNWQKKGNSLTTNTAVQIAGGKAGFTDEGQLYFTPGPGPQKYLVGVEDGQMKLKRIDSAY